MPMAEAVTSWLTEEGRNRRLPDNFFESVPVPVLYRTSRNVLQTLLSRGPAGLNRTSTLSIASLQDQVYIKAIYINSLLILQKPPWVIKDYLKKKL